MASILKHLRSSTADKRPTASGLAEGQIAINTASGTPAVFFKDNNGEVVKVGPAHVGSAAPNAVPAGSSGNSLGELWVDNSLTTAGLKYYTGSTFVNLTPSGTTTTVGLVELATGAETQTGTDAVRAVTPSGLQSKVSDSTSTTSSTTIASSTAVKAAYDLANAALPKAGGTVTGELLIGTTGSLAFEGTTDDSFETTLAVVDPTADRTITFPNVTGTVVTTGDSGTVTSTMIANDTIVNADVNSAAAIAYGKLALSSGIVNTDISASAAIAGTKISPDFGSQTITTAGVISAALGAEAAPSITFTGDLNTGIFSPGADRVAISTGGTERVEWGTSEVVFNDGGANYDFRIEGDTNTSLFFVDASTDRVGLGTSLPQYLLHLGGGAVGAVNGQIALGSITNIPSARIDGFRFDGTFSGQLHLYTTNNVGTQVRAVTIDESQRVGVGTTSPLTKLVVSNNGLNGFEFDPVGGYISAYNRNTSTYTKPIFRGNSFAFNNGSTDFLNIDSSGRLLVGTSADSGGALLQVNGNRIRIATAKTPASAGDTGTTGEVCWDASYIYVCTATNTWKRAALSTW